MKCVEQVELEQFLKGKLPTERMLEIDEHAGECEECKRLLVSLSARAQFAAELVGAADCPDYEELSAYIEGSLEPKRAEAVCVHANLCEHCANDIDRMRELRSHAILREKVIVRPGATRQKRTLLDSLLPIRSLSNGWRYLAVGASLGAVVAVAVFLSTISGPVVNNASQVAVNPSAATQTHKAEAKKTPVPGSVSPVERSKPVVVAEKPARQPVPQPVTVLRDGDYAVVSSKGYLMLARRNGAPLRTALEARIAASIDEKLRTGKIKLAKPVQMAMATIQTRGADGGYEPAPTAPKQISPVGRFVLSAKPSFTWTAVDLADSYRLRVYDGEGNLVAEQVTTKPTATLDRPLARGKVYAWRVGVRFGESDDWTESGASRFEVISTDDYNAIERIRTKLPGSHLALGAAYESVGLYDEAAAEYRLLLRANPNSKLAAKLLHGLAPR